jgi:hypothetical protein
MEHTVKPADFFSDTPPERIIGTETEYHPYGKLGICPSNSDIGRMLKGAGYDYDHEFLHNGAKLYMDCGFIEYASAEGRGVAEATAADFAGLRIMGQMQQQCESLINLQSWAPFFRMAGSYKMPGEGEKRGKIDTAGRHANYMLPMPRNYEETGRLVTLMCSYIATRAIWDGCGLVTDRFVLSQKSTGIGETIVTNGYGNRTLENGKPMGTLHFNSNTAESKIPAGWALFEDRAPEPHMSVRGTLRSLAATSLVARLVEQQLVNASNANDFLISHPIKTLHRSQRSFHDRQFNLASGKTISVADYQSMLFETIQEHVDKSRLELPESEREVPVQIIDICDRIKVLHPHEPDYSTLVPDVEAATKLYFLRQQLQKHHGDTRIQRHNAEAISFDRAWHRVDGKSIGRLIFSRFDPRDGELDKQIERFTREAPNTRAVGRGQAVGLPEITSVDWGKLGWGENTIPLGDPYETYDSLITDIQTGSESVA